MKIDMCKFMNINMNNKIPLLEEIYNTYSTKLPSEFTKANVLKSWGRRV